MSESGAACMSESASMYVDRLYHVGGHTIVSPAAHHHECMDTSNTDHHQLCWHHSCRGGQVEGGARFEFCARVRAPSQVGNREGLGLVVWGKFHHPFPGFFHVNCRSNQATGLRVARTLGYGHEGVTGSARAARELERQIGIGIMEK